MLAEANAAVPRLNPAEGRDMIGKENVLIVDVRDAPELASGGKLRGAVTVSPGLLEFRADPESPYHNPDFQKDRTVLVYCGSAAAPH
jgi:rhodanese-related sulfurtransferase